MRHKSTNKTRPLFTLSLEMTRLVNETRLLLVPCFNSDIYSMLLLETYHVILAKCGVKSYMHACKRPQHANSEQGVF